MTMPADPSTAPPADLSNQINTVLHTAPELGKSPGLSVGIASAGGDVQQNSQATARGTQIISDTSAHASVSQSVGGPSVLSDALDWFGNHVVSPIAQDVGSGVKALGQAGSSAMKVLNAPMSAVQHEYRYLHDVEARHGAMPALLEGLGIAAAGVAGTIASGNLYGGVLASEAATGAEAQLFYKDSWDRTASASYVDPNTDQKVSIGRDLASEVGHVLPGFDRNTTVFKITSGLIDGIFDMNVGGTEVLGLAGAANSAKGLGGVLGDYFPGKAPQTAQDFDNLLNSFSGTNVRRAFRQIAGMSAGEIGSTYRPFAQQDDLLKALTNATTEDDVAEVFRSAIRTHELAFMDKLPTLSVGRLPFQAMREAMGDSDVPGVQKLFRATSRLPTSWDDAAQLWTNKEFDPTSSGDSGVVGVYRTALFTEPASTAASISNEYINADGPGRIRIWKNLQLSTLINFAGWHGYSKDEYLAAAFDDPQVREEWGHAIDEAVSQGMFGKGAIYGLNDSAQDISVVRDMDTGATHAAAITKNQTGKFEYLDLAKMRRAGQILGNQKFRAMIGGFDDFAYDHITSPIFKRWTLQSLSYAFHIALAELIPNSLRLGPFNLVRSAVEGHMANLGIKAENEDVNAVQGILYKTMRKIPGLDITDTRVKYGTDFILGNDGQQVPASLTTAHNIQDEVKPRDEKSISLLRRGMFDSGKTRMKTGDDFGRYGPGQDQYDTAWQMELREGANDDASRMAANRIIEGAKNGLSLDDAKEAAYKEVAGYLRSEPEAYKGFFLRSLPNITSFPVDTPRPANWDQFDEWGHAVVDKVIGATKGQDGTLHVPLLDHIRNGELVDDDELKNIPDEQRPLNVKGRQLYPSGDPLLQRIANWGFRRVMNPMVNFLSRQPIAMAEYINQRELLQSAVDKGIFGDDEAHVMASTATVQKVIDNVHNLTDRTQWTVTFRNWAPFYFAQEQAYRRMGRLLAEDPAAFRKYQLMISNFHDVGQVFSGKNGNGYLVMPGTGFLTAGAVAGASMLGIPVETATPVGMGWNLSASSVIFPLSSGFRPDVGPLLSIPVEAAAEIFPETLSPILKADLSGAATGILGPGATEPIYEQMIPNTFVQRILTAAIPAFNSRSFNSTMMQTLATLDFEGKLPPANANYRTMQTFVDRVQTQTRILYAMKGILGWMTPVSPELTNPVYQHFNQELSADITKQESVAKGLQEFLAKNPDATPFTVWQSSNLTGTSIPSSVDAENWINQNFNLLDKYPNAGILLMPTTGLSTKYNASVYNQQIAQSLRSKLAPGQWEDNGQVPSYIDALYIGAGNSIFYKWLNQYEDQIKGLSGTTKYDAEQAFWGNGTLGSGTVGKYGQSNPVWYQWFNSDQREVQRGSAINQMTKLLDENPDIKTPIAEGTRTLLKGYQVYEQNIATLSTDGASSTLQNAAKDSWTSYLAGVANSDPEMINVITGLFMSIPQTSATPVNISNNPPGVFQAKKWNKAA